MRWTRPLAIGLVAMAAAAGLAACSTPGDESGEPSLTLWARGNSLPNDAEALLAEQFPDWTIEYQDIPDIEDKLRAAIRAKSGLPDVVVMGGSLPTFFEVEDTFLDLAAEAADSDATDWALEAGRTPNGTQVALPTDIGPWGFFYRADVLESLGYPSEPEAVAAEIDSWEAFRALAEATAANGQYACDHIGQVYQSQLVQNGYAYFELEDGEDVNIVDSPISREAFLYAGGLGNDKLCANTEPYTPEWNAAMAQEDIVAFVGPAWEDGLLVEAGADQAGLWRVTTVPGGPAASAGSFVTALSSSKFPDAAKELAAYLGGTEFQTAGYVDKGLFPASTGVAEDAEAAAPREFYDGQDILGQLSQTAKDAPYVYMSPQANAIMGQFFVAVSDLANTGDDPEKVYESLVATASK